MQIDFSSKIDINKINEDLKGSLSLDRYEHVLSVMDTAVILAVKFGADSDKARLAGLLHDIAKEKTVSELVDICRSYGYDPDDITAASVNLLHGPAGALIIKDKYGILDVDIFNAVFYHTTARENMSVLEKVIFVADKIEPLNYFEGIDDIRKKADSDLDGALYILLRRGIKRVKDRGDVLHPLTEQAENYYKRGI